MKLVEKFKCAFSGLAHGINQGSILLQLGLGLSAIAVFGLIGISYNEWLAVLIMIALVLLAEWLNSIIELTVDYISLKWDLRAKEIKDLSAGMVLLICIFALAIGLIILFRNLYWR